jgi:1-acyl-sn-glycerol-3-phosphate acyltransferase
MKILKEIAGRIFATWAILMFVATLLIFLVPFLLFSYNASEPKKTLRFAAYARIWMGIYLPLIGCPLFVRGRKNFAKGENYIVVCNHNSLMDVPISYPGIPGGNKTIAKAEMAKLPLFGIVYRTGSVLVDRKSEQSRKDSYKQMRRVLEMGLHMCLYPEGTRNQTNQPLKSFHDGAFRLAADTGKSIIPGIIFHTRKVLPASKPFFLMPHKLEMHFLPPVPVVAGDTAESLKNKVYKIMLDYFVKASSK